MCRGKCKFANLIKLYFILLHSTVTLFNTLMDFIIITSWLKKKLRKPHITSYFKHWEQETATAQKEKETPLKLFQLKDYHNWIIDFA